MNGEQTAVAFGQESAAGIIIEVSKSTAKQVYKLVHHRNFAQRSGDRETFVVLPAV
jgi:hypothetical protein